MRALALLLLLAACGAPPTLTRVETEVFAKSCTFAACHAASAPADGLNLESPTHAKLVNIRARGAGVTDRVLVVPGRPEDSYLYQKLSVAMPRAGLTMPLGGDVLEQNRLFLVRDWIIAGAQND